MVLALPQLSQESQSLTLAQRSDPDGVPLEVSQRQAAEFAAILANLAAAKKTQKAKPPADANDKTVAVDYDPFAALADELEVETSAKKIDPAVHAENFVADTGIEGDPAILKWRGAWYQWRTGCYHEMGGDELRKNLVNSIKRRFEDVSVHVVANAMMHVEEKSLIPSSVEPGEFWTVDEPIGNEGFIHFPTEKLSLENLDRGYHNLTEATPLIFNLNAVEFNCEPRWYRQPTTWLEFLDDTFDRDDEIRTLQQWFGYCLTQQTNQQKILLLIGPPRSGKGTIVRVLSHLVGKRNSCSPTLASFDQNFGLQPLIGKQLATIGDARLGGKTNKSVIVERLLSISGEDSLTVDRKYLTPWTGRLATRLMILSNEFPRLPDASGALVSRMICLPCPNSYHGSENLDLERQLAEELPAIFWWAIDGLCDLKETGRLLAPASSGEMVNDFERLSSPASAFLADCYKVTGDPADFIDKADVYHKFKSWGVEQGTSPPTLSVFSRDLIAASKGKIRPSRKIDVTGKRFHAFIGLREL